MQAVTRWPKSKKPVQAIAFEPVPENLEHLRRCLAENKLQDKVRIVPAAASDKEGHGSMRPESTMGQSLVPDTKGKVKVVTVDEVLAKNKDLKYDRVIVKIDVEGHEPEVVAGMDKLLASGKVAVVIWERGIEYNKPEGQERLDALRTVFDKHGFTSWRFESEDKAGPLVPFEENGQKGNIIEFAPGLKPEAAYGIERPEPVEQPEDPAYDLAERARQFFVAGTKAYQGKKFQQALDHYAESARCDSQQSDLYNNLGVILREVKKQEAKLACYRRARALHPSDAGIASNLANSLREEGRFAEAAELHEFSLSQRPDDAGMLYNAALVHRDAAAPAVALELLDKALKIKPDYPDCSWDRALLLLQQGNYAEGFPAYESRWKVPRVYKRTVPLTRWEGDPLNGRSIFLHDEQGFGDVMQYARFIPLLKEKHGAGKVVLECQPQLMRLMTLAPGIDAVIPRERAVPQCDVYMSLLSLPGIFGTTLETMPAEVPYLYAPEMAEDTAAALPKDDRLKLGLVWAGQLLPRDRSCPLDLLLPHLSDPRFAPVSLQVGECASDLKKTGADVFVTDMAPYLNDFAETAAVLDKLDLLVTIDTSVAHLAGALGVPTCLLLLRTSDWRWFDKIATSPWYPSFKLFRQTETNLWKEPLEGLEKALREFADGATRRK